MQSYLRSLDLESIRNLFLKETREYLVAVNIETPEELKIRRERIKEIETVLEEKKSMHIIF
jgi:hypothetical protein